MLRSSSSEEEEEAEPEDEASIRVPCHSA
eukprot:COSAG03_NODE_1543_length_3904_cov_11.895664_1_plen_28_part_10